MEDTQQTFLKPFDPDRCAFGRHETFPLRYSWLTKGFQQLRSDPGLFESEDATVRLGVGKNMVSAIRYWLQAARLIERSDRRYEPTMLGMHVFDADGYDPYLEDEATIWLIHWLIATNAQLATAWFWFFNRFHKPEFTAQELTAALTDFSKAKVKGRASPKTVKQDASILLRMYSRSKTSARTPLEDVLDSPLALLGLVQPDASGKQFRSLAQRRDVPVGIIGFAIIELCNALNVPQIPIEQLMYGDGNSVALGAVFRLTEDALLAQLELLVREEPGVFAIRETAGIHQLYLLEHLDPLDMLASQYSNSSEVAA